ncbi:tetratricopeptide repeat protein [Flavobacterium urocaniciphilum]|uniref:Tetratricopeptide repeat-containing protein n=1 Tax=Flavobacterium urocaniciphilum TaxID=1299341 RepID=A0A1H9A9Y6_9FLAO|nr:tetratricopeptide repeat protein [Flavobacterium urocaniciphilum]SEP73479.1 Tetratricopeptide repeat-containing protein [Flavobacterium urocaniciphilum]
MRKIIAFLFLFQLSFGQVNPEEVETAENEFENNFYEALKQKAIENYDKAILSLDKCLQKEPNNPEIHYQLGVNYLAQQNYVQAEIAFKKAVELEPKQRWYWNGLYDVYYQLKDFHKSIPIVEKLVTFDANMKEDLVSLYMHTQQFDKAKKVIDDIESTGTLTKTMEMYQVQIQAMAKGVKPQTNDLLAAIKSNPKLEQNYIDLIYVYSTANQEEKAFETALQLEKEIPSSDMAHVSLVKFYINENNSAKATESYKRVAKSSKIDFKIKQRVLNEYLIFATKNPQLLTEIDNTITYFDNNIGMDVTKEIGKFFYNKNNFELAQKYIEKSTTNDVETIDLLLNIYDFNKQFDKMAKKAEGFIELYPTKANLYYYAAKGNNNLKNYKKAKDFLEMGIDYLIDDSSLEIGFCKQFIICADGLSDAKLKQTYQKRLETLSKQ